MRKTACQIYVPYVQILLRFQVSLKPIMSTKRSAPTKAPAVGAKRQRKMLTIAEKVELLGMLKKSKSYAATGRQYGINESSVRSIKTEENNIGTTAALIFNKDAKKGCNCPQQDHGKDLAKQLGGDGFNDMTPHQLTDADLAEMTNPPSEDEREEEEEDTSVDEDEEDGLTLGRLATMLRMATELQRAAQEWDPLISRSLQFSNIIDGGMSVYKDLFAQKKKERQQLPIIMLFSRKNTHAPRASEEENAAERSQDAAAQSENH